MKRATKDILYFETGPDNPPTLFVDPGEEFEVVTQMNRGPWIEGHPDQEELEAKLIGGNPSSGAIYVNGAESGQVLIVHVLDIQTEPFGYTRFGGSTGAMPGWMGGTGIGHHEKIVADQRRTHTLERRPEVPGRADAWSRGRSPGPEPVDERLGR